MSIDIKFTEEELVAVAKLGILMIEADYVTQQSETDNLIRDLKEISHGEIDGKLLIEKAKVLNHLNMINSISNLDNNKKRYVSAILMNLMNADNQVENEEVALLHFATEMCHLPFMSIKEANELLNCKKN